MTFPFHPPFAGMLALAFTATATLPSPAEGIRVDPAADLSLAPRFTDRSGALPSGPTNSSALLHLRGMATAHDDAGFQRGVASASLSLGPDGPRVAAARLAIRPSTESTCFRDAWARAGREVELDGNLPEAGQLVGDAAPLSSGEARAILWDPAGRARDLGTLGGRAALALSVNDRGLVVGVSRTEAGTLRAFLWDPSGRMRDLGTLGGVASYALAVNERGQVVGASQTADGDYHAFLWDPAAGMRDLGTLGGATSEARGVNAAGLVVGHSLTDDGTCRAFAWDAERGLRDLGTLGGASSEARAVNDRGEVVGLSRTAAGRTHAFLWGPNKGMRDLGHLGGGFSDARGVNDAGQVVGLSWTARGATRAYVWGPDGRMDQVPDLGGDFGEARAVNAAGVVVGQARTAAGEYRAFAWDAKRGVRELPVPGATMTEARAVNAAGYAVGVSWREPPPENELGGNADGLLLIDEFEARLLLRGGERGSDDEAAWNTDSTARESKRKGRDLLAVSLDASLIVLGSVCGLTLMYLIFRPV
jgi:probable HAF family extracellular repeat protein